MSEQMSRWERVAQAVWEWHGKARPWVSADAGARRDYRLGVDRALAVLDTSTATGDELAGRVIRAAFSIPAVNWATWSRRDQEHKLVCGRLIIATAGHVPVR